MTCILSQSPKNQTTQVINADPHSRIALQAYDPVAFYTMGKALKANPTISTEYRGYKYLFSSEENKAIFEKDAEKYLPAFGGFCAYGVALGLCVPVEIDTWEFIDGHLVLQYSQAFKEAFNEQKDENIQKAYHNWPKIEAEQSKSL